jgi:peptidoglycan/xylan/chitin deacetylase (PgdA/CDA1 family)
MNPAVRAAGIRLARRARASRRSDAPILLLYHRIARASIDPQLLCVSPGRFAEHLGMIAERYEPVALGELLARVREGRPVNRCVAVTFDDGYADNLLAAEPLLERAGAPATVFVTSGNVRDGRPFWWDDLERILLRPGRLPSVFALTVAGKKLRFELGDDAAYTPGRAADRAGWTVLDRGDPGPRQSLYRELSARLRVLDERERDSALGDLRSLVEAYEGSPPDVPRPLTADELVRLADGGLVDVGAHSVSHPVLAALPRRRQHEEVAGSKRELEDLLGRPVSAFAYPYGARADFDDGVVSAVRAAGFNHACTSLAGRLTPRTNWFHLPRVLVRDWTGAELERRLSEVAA